MEPTCCLLGSVEAGTSLYLGEVSTSECLALLPSDAVVNVTAFEASATSDTWFNVGQLPPIRDVAALNVFLNERDDLDLIDFSATIGSVHLSTHDDGEAEFVLPDDSAALEFLQLALRPEILGVVTAELLANRGCYVALRGEAFQTFKTFEEYLAHS